MSGLPGLRGAEHIGITVPDFEEADKFFCGVLGAELVFDGGQIADPDTIENILGGAEGDSCRYRFYRLATGLNLEVFEYAQGIAGDHPANPQPGGHHIALYVDDIVAATEHLRRHSVEVCGEPQFIESGPAAGSHWLYFKAPWGLQMELVSYPNGKAYEAEAGVKLWSPVRPLD